MTHVSQPVPPDADADADAAARATPARWRKPAPRKATLREPAPVKCEVDALAVEAAQLIRTQRGLREGAAPYDDLLKVMADLEEGPWADDLTTGLAERLKTLEVLATHRRARTMKGVLFQLYLAAERAAYPQGRILQSLTPADDQSLLEVDRQVRRLHHGALAHLETLAWDEDLAELRVWYLPQRWDFGALSDLAMTDPARLLAEAREQLQRDEARRR